jgi:hypothetical protein
MRWVTTTSTTPTTSADSRPTPSWVPSARWITLNRPGNTGGRHAVAWTSIWGKVCAKPSPAARLTASSWYWRATLRNG